MKMQYNGKTILSNVLAVGLCP